MDKSIKTGRFGYHPDPAIDFCTEVDALVGMRADLKSRIATFNESVERATEFQVGGDENAVNAKKVLRGLIIKEP